MYTISEYTMPSGDLDIKAIPDSRQRVQKSTQLRASGWRCTQLRDFLAVHLAVVTKKAVVFNQARVQCITSAIRHF
jgi:hypothetical protein